MANSGGGDIVFGIAIDIIPIVSERIEQEKASEFLFGDPALPIWKPQRRFAPTENLSAPFRLETFPKSLVQNYRHRYDGLKRVE